MSLSHHVTTEKAIESIKKQAIGKPSLLDHDSSKVIGNIIGIKQTPNNEFWPIAELLPLSGNDAVDVPVQQVLHWLKNNVQLGMSIHGWTTEAKYVEDLDTDEWWIEIDDMIFFENSITVLPAQLETKGKTTLTNSCQNGICSQAAVQIKESIVKTCPAIREALEENELRRTGKKPKLEEKNMAKIEVEESEWKQTQQTLKLLLEGEKERREEAAKVAEKQKMEQLKQDIKAELEEELAPKFTEAAIAASKEVIEETIGQFIQDRTHIRPSLQQTSLTPVQEGGEGVTSDLKIPIKQVFNDPANYPAVMNGEVVQAVTSAQLLGVNQ
jgi:hypothetical protein